MFYFVRHGDLLVKKVSAIKIQGVKKDNKILLEGEATGHMHSITKGTVYSITPTRQNNYFLGYLDVKEEALLTHPEHKSITLHPGLYEFYRQREYDEVEDKMVID